LRIVSSARDDKLLLVGVDRQVDGLDTFQDAINAGRRLLEPSGAVRPTRRRHRQRRFDRRTPRAACAAPRAWRSSRMIYRQRVPSRLTRCSRRARMLQWRPRSRPPRCPCDSGTSGRLKHRAERTCSAPPVTADSAQAHQRRCNRPTSLSGGEPFVGSGADRRHVVS
jgi:hypothetical protein